MWINNCVGGLNYRAFFAMIIFACCNLLTYVLALLLLTLRLPPESFLGGFVAAWFSGGINTVFVILLFNLIALHVYLMHKGISTYEFIMAQREEERKKREQEQMLPKESETQKIEMRQEVAKNERINEELEGRSVGETCKNVIKVKNSEKEEKSEQFSSEGLSHKEKERVIASSNIFGHEMTEKSEHSEDHNKVEVVQQEAEGES